MTLTEPVILTEPELKELCREWQEILRLQDWDVKIEIKRATDFELKNKNAEITWVLSRREAIIKILDPVDYPPECLWPQDMEVSLVHELLHLPLAYCDETKKDSLEEIMLEQAIDTISKSLVRLKRNGQKEENSQTDSRGNTETAREGVQGTGKLPVLGIDPTDSREP